MPEYVVRASYRSTLNPTGQAIVNTFHIVDAQLTSGDDITDVTNDIDTWLTTAYKNVLTDSCTLHDLTVQYEEAPSHPVAQHVKSLEVAGTRAQADAKESPALCQVLALKTTVPKRYARGRSFMPPGLVAASVAEGGTWATANAYWTTVTSFVTALMAGHSGTNNTYAPCVFSKSQLAKGETPFYFLVTAVGRRNHQYFLRSRSDPGV